MPETSDAPDIQRWCADWELARWTAHIPHPYTLDDALAFIADAREAMAAARTVTLAIERAFEPGVIGMIGLTLDGLGVEGDFGWWIAAPHRGQGYASEAAMVMVDFARAMGVARLTAGTQPDNLASQGVARRIGMRPAGRLVRAAPARGGPMETLEFVLTG